MDHIGKILERARDRGAFENLPGAGKPQDLRENPFVPPEWCMAYRLLADNGFAPDVVEDDKALCQRIAGLEKRLESFARRWQGWLRAPWAEAERLHHPGARASFLHGYVEELQAISLSIHTFNVTAPHATQRSTVPLQPMLDAAHERLPDPR